MLSGSVTYCVSYYVQANQLGCALQTETSEVVEMFFSGIKVRPPMPPVMVLMTDDGKPKCRYLQTYFDHVFITTSIADNIGWSAAPAVYGEQSLACRSVCNYFKLHMYTQSNVL